MTESNVEISDARLSDLISGLNIWTSAGRSQQPEIDMDLCCALMELQRVRAKALALRTPLDGEDRKARFLSDLAGVDDVEYFAKKAADTSWQQLAETAMSALQATRADLTTERK